MRRLRLGATLAGAHAREGVTAMDTSYIERNRAQRERLRAVAGKVSDEDLVRTTGEHGWTVAAALAHVAYWDGRMLGTLEVSLRYGLQSAWWDRAEVDAVNEVRLPGWLAMPPREALNEALRTTEAIDGFIEGLAPDAARALAAERPVALNRSMHRGAHLDEIERALMR